ncbi:MAG: efflux RND transporter periplasmic adaptor subunit [Proteobacteria bacterium]|nr:efflux RND transporter periplasmic adaptor subunit [Pseudomonadota bacterium]MBU1715425.1 efflux RND transporter periplasmic adaptor subunit [Pseudomonadota bacterium]
MLSKETFDKLLNSARKAPLKALIITALLALGVAGIFGYFIGSEGNAPDQHDQHDHSGQAQATLWTCGMHPWIISEEPGLCPICNMELTPKLNDDTTSDRGQSKERKAIYWRAPMDSTEIYEQPGKSRMGMDLVPVYEDEIIGGVEIKIDPVTQQNMGLRTTPVVKGPLIRSIRTYGHITFDETQTAMISPKFSGWIEKVYIDFTGQAVEKGQKLFDIYSPELLSAQEEYLVVYKNLSLSAGKQQNDLLASALRRLQYWDVPEDQIREIEKSGEVKKNLTIRSPFTGVVTMNKATEGVFIKAGTTLYQITNLTKIIVEAHIFEYELPWVAVGQETEMTLPYLPGQVFNGKVTYIFPYLQKKTRDVVLRLEFENPGHTLKPDMYADIKIKVGQKGEGLIIPSEAIIRSGERNVVFVDRGNGKFSPREVSLGLALDDGQIQILTGIAPNETVVTSGQFLLDSESKLQEAVQKMLEARKPESAVKEAPKEKKDDFFNDSAQKPPPAKEDDFFKDM